MLDTLIATLQPMIYLFLCIIIGYTLVKTKIIPQNSSEVMAKLETWVFCPALSFVTMLRFCTIDNLSTNAAGVIFGTIAVGICLALSFPLSALFVKNKGSERGIYQYSITFANFGFMGDAIVLALLGDVALSYYKLFSLPLVILVYTWGLGVLVPSGKDKNSALRKLINPPTIAAILGIICGLVGLGGDNGALVQIPFLMDLLNSMKACMGPVAMLLAGATIARYHVPSLIKIKKVYVLTLLRLIILPTLIISALLGIRLLVQNLLSINIPTTVLFWTFFATATPLGLNTIVFPEAYGGDSSVGASMALISHTLCVITIPTLYTLMTSIFGAPII